MKEEPSSGLVRELGLTEALAIGLGTMIGAGIFVLSAIAAQRAGPGAAISYALAGLICLPIAMTVAELATGMPQAGGSYHLISRTLGPGAGAVVGLGNWLGLVFATGFYLIGFAQYVAYFLSIPTEITVLVAGALFIFLNYRGAKLSGRVQNIVVVLLLLILALFTIRGAFNIDPTLHRPFVPYGWGAVAANVGLIIVSFTGFEKISTIAEEVKQPGRNLPLAIVGSVVIATLLYMSILYVATGILSYDVMADYQAPLVEAANRFMSVVGIVGMSLAALLATASSANAAIMASSRINFAMGRDRILPGWFNEIHPRYLTPHRSVLVTGLLAVLLALSGQAAVLAEISSALFMISYALLTLGLLVMRRAKPSWYRPAFRVPLFPWLPLFGGLAALAVIGTMDRTSQFAGLGLIVLGLAWYLIWGRRRSPLEGELMPWLSRERPLESVLANVEQALESRRNEILVPVANPTTAKSLITLAGTLAQGGVASEVTALKVVPAPLNLPLSVAQEHFAQDPAQDDILRRAAKHGAAVGVRVNMLLQAVHGIASGIVAVARNRPQTRLILLGWHGPLALKRIRSSVDKEVVNSAPCDVAVLLDRHPEQVRRILVPAGGGPHARLGLRLAHDLATGSEGEVVILRIARGEEVDTAAEETALQHMARSELGETGDRVSTRVRPSSSVVEGILEEAEMDYDLLVIGASEEWFLRNWLFGAIPDEVAERARCSVLMVRKREPTAVSWLRRIGRWRGRLRR
ncbi:MAG: amino acid permease [Chloroflexia bacterium]|nr:amino acid permease [Chloroflexia bacterium]